jgi:hypothetical protein
MKENQLSSMSLSRMGKGGLIKALIDRDYWCLCSCNVLNILYMFWGSNPGSCAWQTSTLLLNHFSLLTF